MSGLTLTYLRDRVSGDTAFDVDDLEAVCRALDLDDVEVMKAAKKRAETIDERRGPLVTPAGGYTAPNTPEDEEMLLRVHQGRERSGER